jgi:hypothetical protein
MVFLGGWARFRCGCLAAGRAVWLCNAEAEPKAHAREAALRMLQAQHLDRAPAPGGPVAGLARVRGTPAESLSGAIGRAQRSAAQRGAEAAVAAAWRTVAAIDLAPVVSGAKEAAAAVRGGVAAGLSAAAKVDLATAREAAAKVDLAPVVSGARGAAAAVRGGISAGLSAVSAPDLAPVMGQAQQAAAAAGKRVASTSGAAGKAVAGIQLEGAVKEAGVVYGELKEGFKGLARTAASVDVGAELKRFQNAAGAGSP